MNKYFKSIITTVSSVIAILFLFSCGSSSKQAEIDSTAPVTFGDPFVMLYDGVYYAYGTNSPDGIEVFTSTNMKDWKREKELALHKDDSWGDRWFWAPEVFYIEDKDEFFIYYSADEHICVATSDSPVGPFVQDVKKPMLEGEKSIDNSLFIDDDGVPYIYFDRFDDGLNIWVAELEEDLKTIKSSTLTKCINVSQEWEEVWPRVNEGPYVLKHKELYYMTYSANSYESPFYGIGYATATSPMGPWNKYEQNPIFQQPKYGNTTLYGVGHNAFFKDREGNLWTSFHSHRDKDNIHPRAMYVTRAHFTDDATPILVISEKDIIQARYSK